MPDWLLHMSEEDRTVALELVDAALIHLPTLGADRDHASSGLPTIAMRKLPDRRSGGSVTVSRGIVTLRVPLSRRRWRFAADIAGPVERIGDAALGGPTACVVETLETWRSALSTPIATSARTDVAEMARASAVLLTGAAEVLRPGWEMACAAFGRDAGHAISVFARADDGRQLRARFTERPRGRGVGGMSLHLTREIERIVGDRPHAHVDRSQPSNRLSVRFRATPVFSVARPDDPMAILRALHALPAEARLLPPVREGSAL